MFYRFFPWICLSFICCLSWQVHHFSNKFDFFQAPQVAPTSCTAEICESLRGTWTYLDEGNQSVVFQKESLVLKIFKFSHLQEGWYEKIPGFFPSKRQLAGRQKRIKRLFYSHQLAFHVNQEHTALLYVHLTKSQDLLPIIRIQDPYGFYHSLDLNQVYFAVQKKGEKAKKYFAKLLDQKLFNRAVEQFAQLLNMYIDEYKKGLIDHDHNVMINTGFIYDRPFRIDIGKLEKQLPNEDLKRDLNKVLNIRIKKWLDRYYPEYANAILHRLNVQFEPFL